MFGGLARSMGQGLRRAAGSAARQGTAVFEAQPSTTWATRPVLRPFSAMGAASWHRLGTALPKSTPPVQAAIPCQIGMKASSTDGAAFAKTSAEEGLVNACKNNSMVFEIGISFVVMHYQSIFIGVMRCLFQAFRPLLILFVFGQILKAVFFIAGAPIWMSFYSIWLFEVTYGLAQCAISFIFISFFYNNLSFARIRPALSQLWRQQQQKIARAARALM
eukprot:TRINITY_DN1095_c0_g3_i1.p2 TRINITY_DN1095_c0_g3~~TRINITY_DN1095_c0_g3_i1.p2  ORF type:complete len:219 (+),score=55.20 TRINITY_DN1095_c0_g3_i1:158-814(+)